MIDTRNSTCSQITRGEPALGPRVGTGCATATVAGGATGG